jgi:hypothetical protein
MRFLTDFNEIEHGHYIWADIEDAEVIFDGDLQLGHTAELTDGEAHWCVGIITGIDSERGLVLLIIDWQTWRSMRHPRRELEYAEPRGKETLSLPTDQSGS